MTDKARIRINLSTREIEIEGSEEFLKNYETLIADYAQRIKDISQLHGKNTEIKSSNKEPDDRGVDSSSVSFGEFFTKFRKNIRDIEKILIAGYFLQLTKESKSFETREAAALLMQQNVKLTNPSAFIKANLDTRKLFRLPDKGFRVSDIGIEYLNGLKDKGGETI